MHDLNDNLLSPLMAVGGHAGRLQRCALSGLKQPSMRVLRMSRFADMGGSELLPRNSTPEPHFVGRKSLL